GRSLLPSPLPGARGEPRRSHRSRRVGIRARPVGHDATGALPAGRARARGDDRAGGPPRLVLGGAAHRARRLPLPPLRRARRARRGATGPSRARLPALCLAGQATLPAPPREARRRDGAPPRGGPRLDVEPDGRAVPERPGAIATVRRAGGALRRPQAARRGRLSSRPLALAPARAARAGRAGAGASGGARRGGELALAEPTCTAAIAPRPRSCSHGPHGLRRSLARARARRALRRGVGDQRRRARAPARRALLPLAAARAARVGRHAPRRSSRARALLPRARRHAAVRALRAAPARGRARGHALGAAVAA